MNLQRREEILALLAAPVTGEVGQLLEYRDALMECRDHIDTLEQTAAERVIADGKARAVVAPDPTDDCPRVEQTVAHVPGISSGNCFAAVLSGLLKVPIESVPDFDGEDWQKQVNGWLRQFGLAWLQVGGLDEWIPQVGIEGCWHEMSGPTDRFNGTVRHAVAALDGKPKWDPHPSQSGLVEADGGSVFVALRPWELASRAIPADRVLGEGMVEVDLAELEALREFHDAYTEDGECDLDEFLQKLNSVSEKIAALRASQGGAEHG